MTTDVSTLLEVKVLFLDEMLIPLDKSQTRVFRPGDTLTLDQLIIDSSVDMVGNSFWRHIDSDTEQTARWGNPVFARA